MSRTNNKPTKPPRTALVLAGGGARGAYQAGVMAGLLDLGVLTPERAGLDTFVGSSAGAINSTMLAAHAGDLAAGIRKLEKLWRNVTAANVFRTDARALGETGIKWAWDLTFGGALGGGSPKSLLDTAPLREFLRANLPFDRLDAQIESGALRALALSATDLSTADGVLFVHGHPDIRLWERRRWDIRRATIGSEHVMASSAIPIFFPSVKVDERYYGDGSVRNTAPLSPAINLGADRVLAVSVREPTSRVASEGHAKEPTIAQIAGVLLDAVMLDAVEVDLDHSERINRSIRSYAPSSGSGAFRKVDVLWLQPTMDLTALAAEHTHEIPAAVRYLMRGLGSEDSVTELASYLLFAPSFTTRLIEAGRADVLASREAIEGFFSTES